MEREEVGQALALLAASNPTPEHIKAELMILAQAKGARSGRKRG
jgi:hypothetical protein